ncbi:MAG: nitrite/sulfite reductase [Microthrixaceae bacterium]|nr:nitrite/sulfite reductase [Microthrixaceae bacterium]
MTTIEIDTHGTVDIDSIDPDIVADIRKFEVMLARHLGGEIDEDVFKVFRLANGVYGQRQGGHNQMLRVKAPYGAITPQQLDRLADISERYSRGWGHLTTRQNVQFHYVQLEEIPSALWDLAAVGMTSREACSDTVRNVMGCHLAGACPHEVLDIQPWAEATFRHFLRNPISARLPRKFKINFSGCVTDCGQAMFNDVGIIAVNRVTDDGRTEAGFRVFVAGGLGANPHAAQAIEDFTTREELLPTIEACVRVFEQAGNRNNKLRARMKWLVDELGFEEVQSRILASRRFLLASATWPGGIPRQVLLAGDSPAGSGTGPRTAIGQGVAVSLNGTSAYARWCEANVVRGVANGTVSAVAWSRLGDVTAAQFRGLAALVRETDSTIRITNRQNFVLRDLSEDQLTVVFDRLDALGMAQPGAELARDVVACPGADTCNLAVTQSRGLASAIGEALEAAGLAEVDGVRTNISGCTNSCGQHHVADIGFFGAERRAHGRPAPGYQMLLGGYVGNEQAEFGRKALRLPAKAAPEAVVRVVGRYASEREYGEAFGRWLERSGGVEALTAELSDLDVFPTPEENADFYTDFGETGPYEVELGESECAS